MFSSLEEILNLRDKFIELMQKGIDDSSLSTETKTKFTEFVETNKKFRIYVGEEVMKLFNYMVQNNPYHHSPFTANTTQKY